MTDSKQRDWIEKTVLQWAGAVPVDKDDPRESGRLVIEVAGQQSIGIQLSGTHMGRLHGMFMDAYQAERRRAELEKLGQEITAVLVKVAREQRMVGDVLADALHMASNRLYRPWYLVIGRPGSWEASIVLEMADGGEDTTDEDTVALSELLFEMGQKRVDGGDFLSGCLGAAANELVSLGTLARGSWADRIDNLGGQYASDEARADSTMFGRWT